MVTSLLITAAMAGGGVLGIPQALNLSGWVGVLLLMLCGLLSNITANILGNTMRMAGDDLEEYDRNACIQASLPAVKCT